MNERLLNEIEVKQITNLSASSIDRKEKEGTFPKRLAISPRRVVWVGSEIEAWVQATIKKARSNT